MERSLDVLDSWLGQRELFFFESIYIPGEQAVDPDRTQSQTKT